MYRNIEERARLFRTLSGYFNKLLGDGELSDKQYQALIRYSAAILLEEEIKSEIIKPLEQEISSLLTSEIRKQFATISSQPQKAKSLSFSLFK